MATITLRYFAAARAAAGGIDQEVVDCGSPDEAFRDAARRHGTELSRVLDISSFLLDGRSLDRAATGSPVDGAVTLDVLPPFAGG